ncbi:MAG: hypothetical protein H6739_17675 [Alphaproteobacteria bacterium]|nr:hypothetical protein [Alphaproteobacteria bacterium]
MLDLVHPPATLPEPDRWRGVVVGQAVALRDGEPLVDFEGNPAEAPVPAAGTVRLSSADLGAPVALMFVDGDPRKPIIMGRVYGLGGATSPSERDERLVLSAEREITLRCGDASITLTRAGKVLIKGAYVSSRSTGVHRIKGGSVQIN